jgi:hypothetical protein
VAVAGVVLTAGLLVSAATSTSTRDWSRWPAAAWIALFSASAVGFVVVLAASRAEGGGPPDGVSRWARVTLGILSGILAYGAAIAWLSAAAVAEPAGRSPIVPSSRLLGCLLAFFATLAAWPVVRRPWQEARMPLLGLVAVPVGALAATVGLPPDLPSRTGRLWYVAGLCLLLLVLVLLVLFGAKPAASDRARGSRRIDTVFAGSRWMVACLVGLTGVLLAFAHTDPALTAALTLLTGLMVLQFCAEELFIRLIRHERTDLATTEATGFKEQAGLAVTTPGVILGLLTVFDTGPISLAVKAAAVALALSIPFGFVLFSFLAAAVPEHAEPRALIGYLFNLVFWLLEFGLVCIAMSVVFE